MKLIVLLAVPVCLGALLKPPSPQSPHSTSWLTTTLNNTLGTTLRPLLSYRLKAPEPYRMVAVKGPFKRATTNQTHSLKMQTNSSMLMRDWVRKLGGLLPGYFLKKELGRLSLAQWAASQHTAALSLDLFQNTYYFPPYKKKKTRPAKKKELPYGLSRIRYR